MYLYLGFILPLILPPVYISLPSCLSLFFTPLIPTSFPPFISTSFPFSSYLSLLLPLPPSLPPSLLHFLTFSSAVPPSSPYIRWPSVLG